MPELPEVETVRRILERAAVGKAVVGVDCRRPALVEWLETDLPLERLVGARLAGVERRAKYLALRFDRDPQAVLHLRMTGQGAAGPPPRPPPGRGPGGRRIPCPRGGGGGCWRGAAAGSPSRCCSTSPSSPGSATPTYTSL